MSRTCPVQDVQDIENSVGHCPTPALPPMYSIPPKILLNTRGTLHSKKILFRDLVIRS